MKFRSWRLVFPRWPEGIGTVASHGAGAYFPPGTVLETYWICSTVFLFTFRSISRDENRLKIEKIINAQDKLTLPPIFQEIWTPGRSSQDLIVPETATVPLNYFWTGISVFFF